MPSATARTANQAASTHRRAFGRQPGREDADRSDQDPEPAEDHEPGLPLRASGGSGGRVRLAHEGGPVDEGPQTPMMSTAVSAAMLGLFEADDADQEGDAATHHQHRAAKAESMQIHGDLLIVVRTGSG